MTRRCTVEPHGWKTWMEPGKRRFGIRFFPRMFRLLGLVPGAMDRVGNFRELFPVELTEPERGSVVSRSMQKVDGQEWEAQPEGLSPR